MRFLGFIFVIAACIAGYWYYTQHRADVAEGVNVVVSTTNSGLDTAVTTGMKGVAKATPVYYFQNRNYGVSADQNICHDTVSKSSLATIIAQIEQSTKAVSCVADPDYPSRSFTITAPSRAESGKYYCVDQGGTVELIPSIAPGSAFRVGVRCK